MRLESMFNIGDIVFCTNGTGTIRPLTVGVVRIEVTNSPGREGETLFENYKPQRKYKEEYMCVETGIGTGNVYTLGQNIFPTAKEAEDAVKAFQERGES